MDRQKPGRSLERVVAVGAVALGLAAGSYGIASAASSGSSGTAAQASPAANQSAPSGQPWGGQRSDETLLTDGAATKVKEVALAKVPGATVVRVETDADGHAAYEAHMVKSDGTLVTVYVDKQFNVVSVETGAPAPPGGAAPSSGTSA
jgi:hypothetical protein